MEQKRAVAALSHSEAITAAAPPPGNQIRATLFARVPPHKGDFDEKTSIWRG
jgi:hypothetical protein